MKKLLHSRDGASKGASLIIVLAFIVLAIANAINTAQAIAARNISMDLNQGKGTNYNAQRPMATSPCKFIVNAAVVSKGNFYKVGDILDPLLGTLCDPADNYGFRLQVASVDPPGTTCPTGGCVTGVTLVSGIGYSTPPSNPIRFGGSPSGTGFTANCTFQ